MNPDYRIYEQIDRYLKNNLSEEELAQFNDLLLKDETFKATFEAQKDAHELIVDNEMIKLKERMSQDLNHKGGSNFSRWTKLVLFSAAISSVVFYSYTKYFQSTLKVETVKKENRQIQQKTMSSETKEIRKSSEKINSHKSLANADLIPGETEKTDDNRSSIVEITKEELQNEKVPITTVVEKSSTTANLKKPIPSNNSIYGCEAIRISAEVKIKYDENQQGEAVVIIDPSSVKGGTPPYSYSINKEPFTQDNTFEPVKEGHYFVQIKDQNGCISELEKEINIRIPKKEIDDVFTPSNGDTWSFPIQTNTTATISILNKSGLTVYSANINGGYPNQWDGRDMDGNELNTGNYYFIINFANGELLKGHVSIIR
jgi:gliding motility-associated-like protein